MARYREVKNCQIGFFGQATPAKTRVFQNQDKAKKQSKTVFD
jgi:hypothetical protein